jgi:hypothetical protein
MQDYLVPCVCACAKSALAKPPMQRLHSRTHGVSISTSSLLFSFPTRRIGYSSQSRTPFLPSAGVNASTFQLFVVGYDSRARSGLRNDPDAARLVSPSRRRLRPCLFSCDSTASCEPAFHFVASLSINPYSTLSLPGSFPSPTDIPFTTSNSSPAIEPASSHVPWPSVLLQFPASSSRSLL